MKLRSLALNQFKKFDTPTRLDGIGDGLNVVIGPNEMGKSTLLDALTAVVFERHRSGAEAIRALQNARNRAAPVVELAFELDDGVYRIAKRFIKRPYARLDCPDGRRLEGDEAEEALRALLDFKTPAPRGATDYSLGIWSVLWVRQGSSCDALDLPESARSGLHDVLDSEVGAVLGGRRGRALPEEIERQLLALVTETNRKPRGDYRDIIARVGTLEAEVDSLRRERAGLSQTMEALEDAQDRLGRLSSERHDDSAREELAQARQRLDALRQLEARIEAAASERDASKIRLAQAQQARAERAGLKEEIAAEAARVAADSGLEAEVRERERDALRAREAQGAAIRDAEAAVVRADGDAARERRIAAAVADQTEIDGLQQRLDRAREAGKRRSAALERAAALGVDDDAMGEIRRHAGELAKIEARLDAAATRVIFDMTPEGMRGIEVDGRALEAPGQTVQAVEPVTVSIPGRGRITVEPVMRDREARLAARRAAADSLRAALEAAQAKTAADAEDRHERRRQLLQDAELAGREAALHAPATDGREAGAEALGEHVAARQAATAAALDDLGIAPADLPDPAEATDRVRAAEQRAEAARAALETGRAALAGPEQAWIRLQRELGEIRGRLKGGEERRDALDRKLAQAETELPEAGLDAAVVEAGTAAAAQEAVVAGLEGERGEESAELLEARVGRLEQAIEDRRKRREDLRIEISRLRSLVEAADGAGLDETIARTERDLAAARDARARLEHEVAVLSLLADTLRDAERQAKERYLAPVVNLVRPTLRKLFPNAEIAIDENLGITGIVRESGYEEAFDRLSMGTREQIAVLVRLAFARILAEQGRPATVVLDDALIFSDDRRMQRMFDVLAAAARTVQIVVLTCREQLFEDLGGNRLRPEAAAADDDRLASA